LKCIWENSLCPNLSLKDSQRMDAFFSCLNFSCPFNLSIPWLCSYYGLLLHWSGKTLIFILKVAHFILLFCCQYILCCSKGFPIFSLTRFLKFHSSFDRSLNSSMVSNQNNIDLLLCIGALIFDNRLCHALYSSQILNLAPNLLAMSMCGMLEGLRVQNLPL
jgi:hypothetical protein